MTINSDQQVSIAINSDQWRSIASIVERSRRSLHRFKARWRRFQDRAIAIGQRARQPTWPRMGSDQAPSRRQPGRACPMAEIVGPFADVDPPPNFALKSNGLLVKERQGCRRVAHRLWRNCKRNPSKLLRRSLLSCRHSARMRPARYRRKARPGSCTRVRVLP
jgi:hypothetical protein